MFIDTLFHILANSRGKIDSIESGCLSQRQEIIPLAQETDLFVGCFDDFASALSPLPLPLSVEKFPTR